MSAQMAEARPAVVSWMTQSDGGLRISVATERDSKTVLLDPDSARAIARYIIARESLLIGGRP
jgi:hypothetical protein